MAKVLSMSESIARIAVDSRISTSIAAAFYEMSARDFAALKAALVISSRPVDSLPRRCLQ